MAEVNKKQSVRAASVQVNDVFWNGYRNLVRDVVVPYQWDALNDRVAGAEPSYAVRNMKVAAGEMEGEFGGFVFQDSDLYKWVEAAGYLLREKRDPELEAIVDELIMTMEKAQEPDGYLNTYYTLKEPGQRFTNLMECHELYCAGHLMEAGVAYYEATGKRRLLDIACRFADLIRRTFGDGPGQIRGYDGHQEVELALVKLARATGNDAYMALAQYFIDERGKQPSFFEAEADRRGRTTHWHKGKVNIDHAYFQAHLPVREQQVAAGHAVRVVYMCAGMADVARETGDSALAEASERLWRNITERQMYVTGSIGAMASGEAFSVDYDLPNDTAYAETCASIGLIFFAKRMLELKPQGKVADVMERALYNTVLAGMAQDGRSFFYVNPLEVAPHVCDRGNHGFNHVKPVRQEWFGCACCPPNIARLLSSLGDYAYTIHGDAIYSNLFIGGSGSFELGSGSSIGLKQRSALPWSGEVEYEVEVERPSEFELAVRVPGWSSGFAVKLNGEKLADLAVVDGYIRIKRLWMNHDRLELAFEMPVLRLRSHPLVRYNAGKIALQRGPFVYCLEEADNGPQLANMMLPSDSTVEPEWRDDLLGGIMTLRSSAYRLTDEGGGWDTSLYRHDTSIALAPTEAAFIPYYAWANRGKGEMTVWVKELIAQ